MKHQENDFDLDDGRLEQHLAELPVPPMPADLPARCRMLVAANDAAYPGASGQGSPRSRRLILLGTGLVVAAAAAVLFGELETAREQPVPASAPVPLPAAEKEIQPLVEPAPAMASPRQAADPKRNASTPAPQPRPFTVRVQPLQNDGKEEFARGSIEQFFTALINGLRAVPGLTLIVPHSSSTDDDTAADFTLIVKGKGPVLPGTWEVEVTAKAVLKAPDGRTALTTTRWNHQGGAGGTGCDTFSGTAPPLSGAASRCTDPPGFAAAQIIFLRNILFPADPSWQRQLQSRLLDRGLDPAERLQALSDLNSPRMALSNTDTGALRVGLSDQSLDDPVLRGALDLAASAPDPAMRAAVWSSLRGSRNPALVAPMIEALRHEASEDIRLQVATTLAADFSGDPGVREAFAKVASEDTRQLTRMVAQRVLSGDAAWDEYVISTLKDPALSEPQRLEPLGYLRRSNQMRDIRRVLDDEAMTLVAELLPRAWINPQDEPGMTQLFGNVAYMRHPAMRQLAIDSLRTTAPGSIRSVALNALNSLYPDDPVVRAALTRMATEDPVPYLRYQAAEALKPKGTVPLPGQAP